LFDLRAAAAEDMPAVRALLESGGLPTSDLLCSNPRFIVACEGTRIVGAGALQAFGSAALLRSVIVTEELRGSGLGRTIVRGLERMAGAARVRELVLLTLTAERFFEHQGYRVIDRGEVPQAVQGSEEFRQLCPASAICMTKAVAD
jgi:N-acetylglutamate synthase-like GNAT family acetyltransferase